LAWILLAIAGLFEVGWAIGLNTLTDSRGSFLPR
jgi:multidrug transporter EmrE-like cation transporter